MKTKQGCITAADVVKNLRMHFAPPACCFLEQVADGTGARSFRWADGVAMSVWPSRGYDIHGIEVKVSRYDWLSELKKPEKSAAVQQYCNRWWIATPDEAIIAAGELPPTWGWMVLKDKGMRVIREAPALEAKPATIEFVASLLRNFAKAEDSEIEQRISKARSEAREEGGIYYRDNYAKLKRACEEFRAASGIEINEYWGAGDIGEAVRTLRQLSNRVKQIEAAILACADLQQMLGKVRDLSALSGDTKEVTA